jgi:hypothetical protein
VPIIKKIAYCVGLCKWKNSELLAHYGTPVATRVDFSEFKAEREK